MVGKIHPFFPMIGKFFRPFSNDWKKFSARSPALGKRLQKRKVFYGVCPGAAFLIPFPNMEDACQFIEYFSFQFFNRFGSQCRKEIR